MQPDTVINELTGKLINLLMTSFPRTENDPDLDACEDCCLPVISVFKKIDFGILSIHILPLLKRAWGLPITWTTCNKDSLEQNIDRRVADAVCFHFLFIS